MKYEQLKKDLKRRGFSYRGLAQKIGMSGAGLNKAISRHSLRIDTLEKICEVLEEPITKYMEGGPTPSEYRKRENKRKKKKPSGVNGRVMELIRERAAGSYAGFAKEIGSNRNRIAKIADGQSFQVDLLELIVHRYPDVDLYWLLLGKRKYRDKVLKRLDEIHQEVRRIKGLDSSRKEED